MTAERTNRWGTDVPVSLPDPLEERGRVAPMGGFVFTENGLRHDISLDEREELFHPVFAPGLPDEEED